MMLVYSILACESFRNKKKHSQATLYGAASRLVRTGRLFLWTLGVW